MERPAFPALLAVLAAGPAVSDGAEIVAATASGSGGLWSVSVTLRHGDTGWDDYADAWRVVTSDGTVVATRELLHPHVDEKPFTRSLAGIEIPSGTVEVFVEARTNADGWNGERFPLALK